MKQVKIFKTSTTSEEEINNFLADDNKRTIINVQLSDKHVLVCYEVSNSSNHSKLSEDLDIFRKY